MTGNKALIDTNIIIEVFDGNSGIANQIHKLNELYISVVVVGELFVGINRVVNKARNLKKLNEFLKLCTILECNLETAEIYGEITALLYKK